MSIIFTTSRSLIEQHEFPELTLKPINAVNHQQLDKCLEDMVKEIEGKPINILLPLMFGNMNSDLLGLRLALHIRTTPSAFQHANIFIYGTESLYKIRHHEFSCIFTTRGIELIDFNRDVLQKCAATAQRFISASDLPIEMAKIHLNVPANYYDNHSIANIWGMHRILEMAQIDPSSIESLNTERNQLHNIYFKWLLAENANMPVVNEEVVEVKKQFAERLSGLKILRKIEIK